MKIDKKLVLLTVPTFAAFYSVMRVQPVLPAVMMDEYFYSVQSRFTPYETQAIPNFLFSWLYSSTNACGADFYSCAKGLNFVFFLVMLTFIFLIALRLLGFFWATAVTTITALSPAHVYVSYFMPEAMYFAFMAAVIYLFLLAGDKNSLSWWFLGGALLGLTSLVKTHALFAVPAFVLFALLVTIRREGGSSTKSLSAGLSTLAAFVILKFGGGFVFAGTSGLSLFGSSYESSLNLFITSSSSGSSLAQAPGEGIANPGFFEVFIPHSFAHLAVLLSVAGLPLLLSVSVIKDAAIKRQPISPTGQFLMLIGLLGITFSVVVGAFEGLTTSLGDDHSSRIITRYYEFLFPMLLVAAGLFGRFVEPRLRTRLVQSTILIVALIFGFVFISKVNQSFADSIILSGYLSSPSVIPIIASIGIVVAIVWILNASSGSKLVVYAITPLVLVISGLTSQNLLLNQVGTQEAFFDIAGQKAKTIVSASPGESIAVIGPVRYQNFTTKFWIDKPGIRDVTLSEGQTFDASTMPDVDYVILLAGAALESPGEVIEKGDGFSIVMLKK